MNLSAKKILNSEEQSRPVNPPDSESTDTPQTAPDTGSDNLVVNDNPAVYEQPGASHDNETPTPVEGDDAGDLDHRAGADN